MRKTSVLASILVAASGTATAADNGVYVGVSVGQATIEDKTEFAAGIDTVRLDYDQDDLGYKVLIGIRPLDWLGLEANYANFGEPEQDVSYSSSGTTVNSSVKLEGYGIAGYVVGFIPIGPVDIFGKAGLVSWDTKAQLEDITEWQHDDGEDLAYGVGVQFRLLSLGVRAEYEIYDIDGLDDANLLSIGVTYTFL